MIFAVENFSDMYEEARPLIVEHARESASYPERMSGDLNLEIYRAAEKSKQLVVVTARDGAELVGYLNMFLQPSTHHRGIQRAVVNGHFLMCQYRAGWNAANLIKAAEHEARARGVNIISIGDKASAHRGAIYRRLGYDRQDEIFHKWLGD